jgi:hypothetical protein
VLLAGDAPSLDAACFAGLDPLEGSAERIAPPFEFPDFVRGVALHVWKEQSLPSLPIKSQYEQRAIHRAALLYLRVTQHNTSFPPALVTQWLRLFGEKWATSENGRGVKDLLRALGVVSNDAKAREWLARVAGG